MRTKEERSETRGASGRRGETYCNTEEAVDDAELEEIGRARDVDQP